MPEAGGTAVGAGEGRTESLLGPSVLRSDGERLGLSDDAADSPNDVLCCVTPCDEGNCPWKAVDETSPEEVEDEPVIYKKTYTVYSESVALASSPRSALLRLASSVDACTVMLMFETPDAGATPEIDRLSEFSVSQDTAGFSSIPITALPDLHRRGTKSIIIS